MHYHFWNQQIKTDYNIELPHRIFQVQVIFSLINKSIRFNDIQELVKTLESEHKINKDDSTDLQNKIEQTFKNTKRITAKRVSNVINKDMSILGGQLKNLETGGKIILLGIINELACNQCNSVRISQSTKCPQCKAVEFRQ